MNTELDKKANNALKDADVFNLWCHPKTYHEYYDEISSYGSYLAPEEHLGANICTSPDIPEGEFLNFPSELSEFGESHTFLEQPPRELVRELIESRPAEEQSRHGGLTAMFRVGIYYKLEEKEYRFDIEKIRESESIPRLETLVQQYLPAKHPLVDPEDCQWETFNDELDVYVSDDGEWIWNIEPENRIVPRTISFRVARLEVEETEMDMSYVIEEMAGTAINAIGKEHSNPIYGHYESVVRNEPSILKPAEEGGFYDVPGYDTETKRVEVGEMKEKLGGICMDLKYYEVEE